MYIYIVHSTFDSINFILPFSIKEESEGGGVDVGVVSELKSSLERVEKELNATKERKACLERECVIYQSQLDVSY